MKRFLVPVSALAFSVAHAGFTDIDLSPYTNDQAGILTQGGNYPDAGYSYLVNGVPFTASSYGGPGSEGMIALGPSYKNLDSVTIAVDQAGLQSVYTEINSAFGAAGAPTGQVILNGSSGTVIYNLVEGFNIRDHYYGFYVNTVAPGIGGTVYWSGGVPTNVSPGNADSQWVGYVRNDIQGWVVPTSIGELLSVEVTYGNGSNYLAGEPLIFGLTTSTNPLAVPPGNGTPGPAAAVPFGLAGIGAVLRRRRR